MSNTVGSAVEAATSRPPRVCVMGVSGCGKSTVGAALAQRLRVPFADADDFHPEANVAKMAAGIPLTDADRAPWLDILADWLRQRAERGGVLGCSALKRAYRDVLRQGAPDLFFLHLRGTPEAMAARVARRPGHFMPASLVESQFATLEDLQPDEAGLTLDFALSVDALVDSYALAFPDQALPDDPMTTFTRSISDPRRPGSGGE